MPKILSKFVCLTLILTVVCSGYSKVLCYGNDGHVAIEPVFHNHCHHDEHDHEDNQDRDPEFSDSCDPCEDILISNDLEPVRLSHSTESNDMHFNISFSAVTVSCYAVSIAPFEASSFFKPLSSIRLLT
ncbi:MAG: hypothetical protein ABFR90_08160 [Planctomycetota bacterium]